MLGCPAEGPQDERRRPWAPARASAAARVPTQTAPETGGPPAPFPPARRRDTTHWRAVVPEPIGNYETLFEASFARVVGDGAYNPAFTGRFYEIFLAKSPAIAERFAATDMSAQKTMLHDSLHTLVNFNREKALNPQLRRLAAVHSRRRQDVAGELYDVWLDALLAAVAEFDAEFNDAVELAWRLTLSPGITYMRWCYDR